MPAVVGTAMIGSLIRPLWGRDTTRGRTPVVRLTSVSDRFMFRRGSGESDPWFRIGTLDVGTTMLLTLASVVGFVLYAVSPSIISALVLVPGDVLRGYVWTVLTWPLANAPDLWSALTIFFFWYFGTQLEQGLGKRKFLWLLGLTTLTMSVIAMLISLVFQSYGPVLGGLGALQLIVVLLFIAENPHIRFFFNIPGWLIGAVLVLLPVLQYVGNRAWLELLNLLLGLVAAAIIARAQGMLADYHFIPQVAGRRPAQRRPTQRRTPKAGRTMRRRGQHPAGSGQRVVQGPWTSVGAAGSPQAELDALLDKISASGMESLSTKEKNRLQELSRQLRGR